MRRDIPRQLDLFESRKSAALNKNGVFQNREMGTFKDSLKAPVFRWFKYPAGYSYKFVDACLDEFGIEEGDCVYEPFSGSGTTLMVAKMRGIHGYGVEAHSFVHWVAGVKLFWEFDLTILRKNISDFMVELRTKILNDTGDIPIDEEFPALVVKCFHPDDLRQLLITRNLILECNSPPEVKNLLKLGLTDCLRTTALAGTGWPYISPKKNTGDRPAKNAMLIFEKTMSLMLNDLAHIKDDHTQGNAIAKNVLGDSRERQEIENEAIGIAVTSPPYLNNYDYADRTRLETYFWGLAHSWGDITKKYRKKLMVAATTQISRSDYDTAENVVSRRLEEYNKKVYTSISNSVKELAIIRLQKGGKKDYDLMVALYFNDVCAVLEETFRVLRKGAHFCLVLGDSAPYGIHIPTDEYIGQLGLGIGFRKYSYHQLRTRGDKWKANPQRHNIPLREGVVVLEK